MDFLFLQNFPAHFLSSSPFLFIIFLLILRIFTVIYPDREKGPLLELNPHVMPFMFLELNSELFHIFSVTTQRKKFQRHCWTMVFGKVNCFNIHNIADQSFTFHQSRVPSLEDGDRWKISASFCSEENGFCVQFYVQTRLWYRSCTSLTTWTE